MLSNLIYKPLDASALATKAQTYHSTSPQNRFNESFNDKKLIAEAMGGGAAPTSVINEEEIPTRNVNSKTEMLPAESSTKSPTNQMDTLGNEPVAKQNSNNPLLISHVQALSMTNATP